MKTWGAKMGDRVPGTWKGGTGQRETPQSRKDPSWAAPDPYQGSGVSLGWGRGSLASQRLRRMTLTHNTWAVRTSLVSPTHSPLAKAPLLSLNT